VFFDESDVMMASLALTVPPRDGRVSGAIPAIRLREAWPRGCTGAGGCFL